MDKKLIDQIDLLAKKMGVAAEHMYGVLYHQQIVFGIVELFISLLIGIAVVLTLKFACNINRKALFENKEEGYFTREIPLNFYARLKGSDFYKDGWFWFIGSSFWALSIIACVIMIPDGTMRLLNPEYYAIKDILDSFK